VGSSIRAPCGVSTRLADRPEGRRLSDLLRAGDVLVVRWVDRLGRNYRDVTDTIREFMRRGIIVRTVINGMVFDGSTKDPMQQAVRDALIAFMAATAEAQAEATKEAQRAGIEFALANDAGAKYRGRKPTFTWDRFNAVQELLSQGIAVAEIAKAKARVTRGYRCRTGCFGSGARALLPFSFTMLAPMDANAERAAGRMLSIWLSPCAARPITRPRKALGLRFISRRRGRWQERGPRRSRRPWRPVKPRPGSLAFAGWRGT